jgi:Transposase DDE domain group 1
MTECSQSSFGFEACGKREIVARFDGGAISSDGGAFLLRQTDKRLNLLPRLSECFLDGRNQKQVEHSVVEMVSQRIYGLALGYEDVNDHEQLRRDAVFGILAGRAELEQPLAGKSTLNRMELGSGQPDRYKKITFWKEALDELLVKIFIEAQQQAPEQIVLDVDTTDLPLHGQQEGRFFHGYYDCYCYLALYIFCGEHVLCARLREANHDAAFGSRHEIERIVAQIRTAWPTVKIILRGDSGFCRNVNELVRKPGRGLCVWHGAQSETAQNHRRTDARSHAAVEPYRQAGAGVHRVRVPDKEDEERRLERFARNC